MNTLKTVFLMTLMTVVLLAVGSLAGGEQGMVFAFLVSLLMNFGSYWFSDKIVLRMYKAREVTEAESPRLYRIVVRVAEQVGLPVPRVYIIPGESPNAFATGRNPQHAAIAVTEGILSLLNDDELEGVVAHEFAHIKNRDILTGTIVATMVGTVTFVARMIGWSMMFGGRNDERRGSNGIAEIAMMILAPIAAVLIQMAVSRSREFAADAGAAQATHKPMSLAAALQKLEKRGEHVQLLNASPASAHLFILNPLKAGGLSKLFSTHPSTSERVEALHQLAVARS